MLVYSNKAGTLHAEQACSYLHLTWHEGVREDHHIQELFHSLLQHLLESGWRKAIINQRLMHPASVEVEHWFRTNWLPQALTRLGACRVAIVLGQDVLTRLVTVSLVRESGGLISHFPHLTYNLFYQEDQAIQWLLEEAAAAE